MELGYPELALGDLYKAKILVEEALRHNSPVGAAALLMVGRGIAAGEYGEVKLQEDSTDAPEQATDFPGMKLSLNIVKQMEHTVLQSLITALRAARSVKHALQMCKDSRLKHPDAVEYKLLEVDIRSSMTEEELRSNSYDGYIHRRVYPWMTIDLLHRNQKTLAIIQKEFSGVGATIEVKQSQFLKSLFTKDPPSDLYGLHAINNIPEKTVVFFDSSLFFATAAQGRCPSCAERLPTENSRHKCGGCSRAFCSEACWWRAAVEIHDPLCGRDFSYLYSVAKAAAKDPKSNPFSSLEPLLLVRVLATMMHPDMMHMLLELQSTLPPYMARVVEANSKTWTPTNPTDHPLTQPIISRLTANYNSDVPLPFSYESQIVNPTRILRTLGVDIFVNHAYDTWVLETIRHRICNNRLGAMLPGRNGKKPHPLLVLHPCYAMLNHSCEPNCCVGAGVSGAPGLMGTDGKMQLRKKNDDEGAGIVIMSTKKIKKGEELFISYVADIETMPREERQRRLSTWLGEEGCKCGRCEREKAEVEAMVKVEGVIRST